MSQVPVKWVYETFDEQPPTILLQKSTGTGKRTSSKDLLALAQSATTDGR